MNAPARVKICGITNEADALAAADAGADALGFNLWPRSKRFVRVADLDPWLGALAGRLLRVAVMVNPALADLRAAQPLFDIIQLHGQETAHLCADAAASGRIWKAFPVLPGLDVGGYAGVEAILLDSAVPGAFGGTGALADLGEAAAFLGRHPGLQVWLSGGLDPGNVAAAIEKVRPYGVDVASGVELPGHPRRKDHTLIRAFIAAARSAASISRGF